MSKLLAQARRLPDNNNRARSTSSTVPTNSNSSGESENRASRELSRASRIPVIQSDLKRGASTRSKGVICQRSCNCNRQLNTSPLLKGKVTITTKKNEEEQKGGGEGDDHMKKEKARQRNEGKTTLHIDLHDILDHHYDDENNFKAKRENYAAEWAVGI